jgi:hypothetical protein
MVDLAIAANFVRELTEEQFAEQRGNGRRGTTAQPRHGARRVAEQRRRASRSEAATRSVNGSDTARESARSEPTRGSRTRNETSGLRRALARFAQVRG